MAYEHVTCFQDRARWQRVVDSVEQTLCHSIGYSGHSEKPLPAAFSALRRRGQAAKVASRTHSVAEPVKVSLQVGIELFDHLTVYPIGASTGFDRLVDLVNQFLVDN